ncbi:UvrD-helicase domain-containing protein [Candidatus Microgenomates bacterium]|nr:UvrD-helicase domain-containing protein [Candidatus Microgenomates bacterium]
MKSRMGAVHLGYVGTFHTFCAKMLRIDGEEIGIPKNYVIYDDNDQRDVIKKITKSLPSRFTPSYFLNRISGAKNELITPEKYRQLFSDYSSEIIAGVYQQYQKELTKCSALDFDDLLMKAIELLKTRPEILQKYHNKYQYLMVDEFQDTNVAQYTLTKVLGEASQNVTIVGDFSQSIYSWRGADIRNLQKFETDFPNTKIFKLEQNYRSTQPILNYAYEVISVNRSHPILGLFTDNTVGEEVVFYEADDEQDEIFYVIDEIQKSSDDCESFAVLYRTNAQSRVIEEALLHQSIPYVLIGGTRFYERKEVKDVLSYLRLLVNPNDEVSQERIKKLGKRRYDKYRDIYAQLRDELADKSTAEFMDDIFNATGYLQIYNPDETEDYARLENIKELKSVALNFPIVIEFLEQVALVESEYSDDEKNQSRNSLIGPNKTVKLMTLHQAKGLEFDCVFIVGLEEGILPHAKAMDEEFGVEEERRLFYVGITRARKKLYITRARRRFIFGRRNDSIKSRFLSGNSDY